MGGTGGTRKAISNSLDKSAQKANEESKPTKGSQSGTDSGAETRHATDKAWFLSNPTLWSGRQQQVVAVFDRTILGEGPGFGTAYQTARQRCPVESKPCPDPYELTFIVVPDVVAPEGAPDWNPLEPAAP
jgi:hypothetical protein